MNNILTKLSQTKIIPVVVIKTIEDAFPTLNALKNGGLPVAEITFRTACAPEAIQLACKEFPDILIGAGTIINAEQCEKALESGAKFIVSPGFSKAVAEVCIKKGVNYFPGCVTPTEIMEALSLGLNILKFFPAQNFGGLNAIKALSSAFPAVKFIPTGGIDDSNIIEYLKFDKIFACGGSWMLKGSFGEMEEKTKKAVLNLENL